MKKKTYLVVIEIMDDCDPAPLTKQEIVDLMIDGNRATRPSGITVQLVAITEEKS